MVETNLLLTAGAILVILAVGGGLAHRVGHSVIPAYILVGMVVGPHAPSVRGVRLTLLERPEAIQLLADLGIVFLLFFVGLELGLDRLLEHRRRFLVAGTIDVAISLPLGIGIGLLFGFGPIEALFIGAIVFNSSTAIIAKTLLDLGWIANAESEAILGIVVIEDIVTAFYLAVLSAVLLGTATSGSLARSLGLTLSFLAGIVIVAYFGSRLIERAFETRSSELFVIGVIGSTALVAGAGLALGVSAAVVAFVVGTAFGRTRLRAAVEHQLTASRDFFAVAFFFLIGMQTDPRVVLLVGGLIAVAAAITVPGQVVSGYLAGRAYGLRSDRAVRVGCALAPRGEFSLVIAAFLVTAGTTDVLRETIPAFAVGYVLVTSVIGTVLIRYCGSLERLLVPPTPAGDP